MFHFHDDFMECNSFDVLNGPVWESKEACIGGRSIDSAPGSTGKARAVDPLAQDCRETLLERFVDVRRIT